MNTDLVIVAICERSKRCAASTADTMAPSSAERSTSSSVTKNFRAKLKKAAGPFATPTAIVCRGCSCGEADPDSPLSFSERSESFSVAVVASTVVGVSGARGPFGLASNESLDNFSSASVALPPIGTGFFVPDDAGGNCALLFSSFSDILCTICGR